MAVVAVKMPEPVVERAPIRRFELPDLDSRGAWLLERLGRAFLRPDENQLPTGTIHSGNLASFLKGSVYSNEFLFLLQEHSAAMAQVEYTGSLAPLAIVRERFVFVQYPENKDHIAEAAEFYVRFATWAKHLGAKAIVVAELYDVTQDLIREKLGRLFTRQMLFARV